MLSGKEKLNIWLEIRHSLDLHGLDGLIQIKVLYRLQY